MPDSSRAFTYIGELEPIAEALKLLRSLCPIALIERITEVGFVPTPDAIGSDIMVGRAFGQFTELRWRKDADRWHALLISDDPAMTVAGFTTAESRLTLYNREQWHLWGTKDDDTGEWLDGRIPGAIHYPGVSAQRAMLEAVLYCVDDEPVPSIARYCALVDGPQSP